MSEPSALDAVFAIRLSKQSFTFSAAHFITYAGDVCEPLHGHNYRVRVEATGPLDANQYVLDFVAARDAVAAITNRLDHRVLLPTEHPLISVQEQVGPSGIAEIVATFDKRRWVFPAEECVLLPIPNTTAELLAWWIGTQLRERWCEGRDAREVGLVIEVDECDGQSGICRF